MKHLGLTLKLLAPIFYLVAALHLVFGLGADAMLGARVPDAVVMEPSLSSQNRFYGMAFALYGVVFQLCAGDLRKYEALFKATLWVFFAAGCARLVPWVQYGSPAPMVSALMVSEWLAPLALLLWHAKAKRAA